MKVLASLAEVVAGNDFEARVVIVGGVSIESIVEFETVTVIETAIVTFVLYDGEM